MSWRQLSVSGKFRYCSPGGLGNEGKRIAVVEHWQQFEMILLQITAAHNATRANRRNISFFSWGGGRENAVHCVTPKSLDIARDNPSQSKKAQILLVLCYSFAPAAGCHSTRSQRAWNFLSSVQIHLLPRGCTSDQRRVCQFMIARHKLMAADTCWGILRNQNRVLFHLESWKPCFGRSWPPVVAIVRDIPDIMGRGAWNHRGWKKRQRQRCRRGVANYEWTRRGGGKG